MSAPLSRPPGARLSVWETAKTLFRAPWTGWVGFRYLKSKKNSRFLSFITLISIGGVALGVTAMIVVLSVMDGFENELKKRLMNTDLHAIVRPSLETPGFQEGFVPEASLASSGLMAAMQSDPRVQSVSSVTQTEAVFRTRRKVSGVVVKGVSDARLEELKPQIVETASAQLLSNKDSGRPERMPGLFVGQELAHEIGVDPGDEVTLISPTETDGPLASVPRMKKFVIEGIYHSGVPEQELHTVFARQASVRSFLRRAGVVSQWEVVLKRFDDAPRWASDYTSSFPETGYAFQDWMQLNSHLFASLRLERLAMFISLAFIVIVASFNIITTLTLMVLEKKKEIAILKAMGAKDVEIGAIFMAEGAFIGGTGVGLGLVSGFLLCYTLKQFQWVTLPDVYYDRKLPVSFLPEYYLMIAGCALVIVLAACIYPSRRAARVDPLVGIRYG